MFDIEVQETVIVVWFADLFNYDQRHVCFGTVFILCCFFVRSDLFLLRPCQLPIHLWCFTIMAVSTGKMRKVLWSLVVAGIVFHSELILMRDQSWSNCCRTDLFLFVRQCNQLCVMLAVVKEILVNKGFYIIVNKQLRIYGLHSFVSLGTDWEQCFVPGLSGKSKGAESG